MEAYHCGSSGQKVSGTSKQFIFDNSAWHR